jgi:FkbM family methyltransferase
LSIKMITMEEGTTKSKLAIYLGNLKFFATNPTRALKLYIQTATELGRLQETFLKQRYYWLAKTLKPSTTVIDIGSGIGDTPLYFAQFPYVKSVIAYEPDPAAYRRSRSVLSKTYLGRKIIVRNKFISSSLKEVIIPDNRLVEESAGSDVEKLNCRSGVRIKGLTLGKALAGIKNVAIKCNCEGAELTMFDDANLGEVYAIMLECHNYRQREKVMKTLSKKGFTISSDIKLKNRNSGFICAEKIHN